MAPNAHAYTQDWLYISAYCVGGHTDRHVLGVVNEPSSPKAQNATQEVRFDAINSPTPQDVTHCEESDETYCPFRHPYTHFVLVESMKLVIGVRTQLAMQYDTTVSLMLAWIYCPVYWY